MTTMSNKQFNSTSQTPPTLSSGGGGGASGNCSLLTNEDYLNKKITFIQNHINNLLIEITNLPEPWSYAVTEDGRVFFINEKDRQTTWLHPKTGQPVSIMIIPPIEDLPNGWQKDYILGLPYLIDHNSKRNYPITALNKLQNDQQQQYVSDYQNSSTLNNNNYTVINNNHNSNNNYANKMSMSMIANGKSPMNNNHNQNYHNLQEQQQQQQLSGHSNHLPADANINLTSSSCSNSSSLSNKDENSNEAAMAPMTSAAIDSALRKCGWLHKLSQNGLKLWRKRYFVLTDYILDYYSDSTRSKHCGTIFLNNTHSRPTVKKDGSSAFNRKHSFKVELVQPDLNDHNNGANSNNSDNSSTGPSSNNNYIYLAADSAAMMNEWINNFNFVSKMKNNSHHHRNFNEKKPSSQRSLSNTSTRTNASVNNNNGATLSSNNFVIKHDSLGGGKRSSKSNSAPSSPSLNRNSLVLNDQSKKQLRSSLSSNRIEDKSNPNRKLIKKKLAFSDDEILNDVGQPQSHQQPGVNYNKNTGSKSFKFNLKSKKSTASDAEMNMTDYESNENLTNLNNSYHRRNESFEYNGDDRRSGSENAVLKHKRSSSLTKAPRTSMSSSVTNGLLSARSNRSSNLIYDYRPIYEAFEKPILDMNAKQGEQQQQQQQQEQFGNGGKVVNNLIMSSSLHGGDFNRQSRFNVSYIDKEKIAAAAAAASAAAASAAAAALEKDKDRDYYSTRTAGLLAGSLTTPNLTSNASSSSSASTSSASSSSASNSCSSSTAKNVQPVVQPTAQANNSNSTTATASKPITNLYTLNKSQIEGLPKSEIQMLIRQLRRNFVLLNHSQQRFSLLHKLYEPYELIYQQRQSQSQLVNHKMTDDSLNMNELTMCMHDSFQTIYNRIKKIELKMDTVENCLKVAQQCETSPAPSSSSSLSSNNSQNNPTIYEDLVNVDNQYSQSSCLNNNNSTKFQNLLKLYEYQIVEMQHEYELLLEDKIIVDKLLDNQMRVFSNYKNLSNEKSLIQQFNALNQEMDLLQSQLLKANQLLNDTISEKCKHELIHHQQQQMMQQRANNTNNFNQTNKPTADSSNLFRANLVPVGNETSSNFTTNMHSLWRAMSPTNIKKQNLTGSSDNLANGVNLPIRNQPQVQQPQPQQQQNRNQPMNQYVSQVNGNVSRLNDISKSIDSIYSPSSSCSSNKTPNVTMSAFKRTTELASNADESCNSTSSKEKEIQISFQPINFTNSRPKPAQMGGMVPNKSTNFKRDFIAEKKRSSIGKYPQNYYYQTTTKSNEYFQPIPVHHTHSQQSARERLFGNNQLSLSNNTSQQSTEADSLNSRKIALVRPEMRGSCDKFTQQNQMEYFDADYTEELVKNIQKPEVFSIPRGNIDIEPEIELTDEEKKAKERKVLEIKKMIALQSLQQMNLNDSSSYHDQGPSYLSAMYNNNNNNGNSAPTTSSNIYQSSNHSQNTNNNMYTSNGLHSFDFNFEKEKKAREQLLDLRHELAEQIKEKTRQAAANSTSNGASSSLSPSSSNDLDNNNQITETPKQLMVSKRYGSYFNSEEQYCVIQNSSSNQLTPSLPDELKFIFDITNVNA